MGVFMNPSRTVIRQWLSVLMLVALPGAASFAQTNVPASPAVALKGHDTVAYFTEKRPVMGTAQNGYEWDGSRYLFSSARNREMFAANPDHYAPQFGGLCATGLGMGMKTAADPNVWKIVDGKLYVFSSVEAKQAVDKDPTLLTRAHQAWKGNK
jgi:YHS domain-containing protein